MRTLLLVIALAGCGQATEPTSGTDAAPSDAAAVDTGPDARLPDGGDPCAALTECCPRVTIPEYRPYCDSTAASGDVARCALLLADPAYCPP